MEAIIGFSLIVLVGTYIYSWSNQLYIQKINKWEQLEALRFLYEGSKLKTIEEDYYKTISNGTKLILNKRTNIWQVKVRNHTYELELLDKK